MEMVRGSSSRRGGPACAVSAPGGYRSTRSLRLRPLSGAVLLSRQAFVRWDAQSVGSRLWGGQFPAPVALRGPGVRQWRYEHVCPAQVRDPYASLVWLVGAEPPDPRVNKVVRDLHPGSTSATSCGTEMSVDAAGGPLRRACLV